MSMFQVARGPNGEVLQSAVPKQAPSFGGALRANGLLVRGVVLNVYFYDDQNTPSKPNGQLRQSALYCDVLCYSGLEGNRTILLRNCLVSQERTGMHEGDIWIPRKTTMDITGAEVNPNTYTNPANMDGDHVLVGFMDNDLSLPVILRQIPHPNADEGTADSEDVGHRLKLVSTDGQPRFIKHRGTYFGVDPDGNFIIDTTQANSGEYESNGAEEHVDNAGEVRLRLPTGTKLTVLLGTDRELEIDEATNTIKLKVTKVELGDSASQAVVLGNTWTTARATMDGQIQAAMTAVAAAMTSIAAFMTAYATANPPPKPDGTAAAAAAPLATAAQIAAATAATGIATFEAGAANYLSVDVKTR